MYQVTIKGRTLEELKKAVQDINDELSSNVILKGTEKILEAEKDNTVELSVVKEDEEEEITGYEPVVDLEGLPWDERIHASSKELVSGGTWRKKRGVDKDLVKQIKAELKAKLERAENPISSPELPVAVQPQVVQPAPQPVAVQPQVVAPPMPSQVSNGHTFETFSANFPLILGNLITEGKIPQDYVNSLKEYFKLDQIWNASEEQKREMYEGFAEYGFIQKV